MQSLGRFQVFVSIMMIMGFTSGFYVTQLLQFLELQPKYICSDDPYFTFEYKCAPYAVKDLPGFCQTSLFYKVDWSQEYSLKNWFEELDLSCTPKTRIGLIGSSLFIGWALSALFVPRLSDLFGRKRIFIASMGLQTLTFIGLYFSTSINITTSLMFFWDRVCGKSLDLVPLHD